MRKHTILLGAVVLGLLSALGSAQVPFIDQPLVPDATTPGGPKYTLTINGAGFVSDSVVNWNGNALLTRFVNSSQLTATVPAVDIATATTASVTAVNPAPGGGTSNVVFSPITVPTSTVAFSRRDLAVGALPDTVATGDFNGDGKLDLAVANDFDGGGSVSILLGKGDGTFRPQVEYAVGKAPSTVLVGDFNGDGILDVAVCNQLSNTVSVLLGNGDGTFQAALNSYTGDGGSSQMVAGDFNRDGKLDLATVSFYGGFVAILLGQGDGTFKEPVDYALPGGSTLPIAVGDLTGDGKLDLVVADSDGSEIAVLLGNGDGTFQPYIAYPTTYFPESVVLADFNGDGKLDLAASGGGAIGTILLGNGDGTFREIAGSPAGCELPGPWCQTATADLRGDGKLDLVVPNFSANTVQVLLGNGDGTFQNPLSFATGSSPSGVAIGDFNGDGRLDLAVANWGANSVSVFLQQAPGPAITVSPSSLSFGNELIDVASKRQTVALTNTGAETLDIPGIVASTNFVQHNDCGSSVLAGASCTISVIFSPTTIGPKTGALTITDSASNSPQTVTLMGIGTVLSLSTTKLEFGNETVGTTSSAQTVTLTNHAPIRAVSISDVSIRGGNSLSFAQTNNCGASVAPGASCTFSVTFTPQSKGINTSALYIRNGGGDTPEEVKLSGDGT